MPFRKILSWLMRSSASADKSTEEEDVASSSEPKPAPPKSPKIIPQPASDIDPAVLSHIRGWIDAQARSGFAHLGDLYIDLKDVVEDEGLDYPANWRIEMDMALTKQREREASFPSITANDRLTDAFKVMNQQGLIALENAGYTQSDGWDDLNEIYFDDGQRALGGVFYHGQDVERGITGAGLNIRFGGFGENASDIEVGRKAVSILKKHGFDPIWNEDPNHVIDLPPFEWQRRQNRD